MVTLAKIVSRSLRLIQVIDPNQQVKPSDMETGIEAMNAMLRRWEADSLSLGWSPVTNPSDVLPIPEEAEQAVAYNLAVILAPEYGVTPLQSVVLYAESGLNSLLRDQAVATPIMPMLDCPSPSNWNGRSLNGETWFVG